MCRKEVKMTQAEKEKYKETEELRRLFSQLKGKKFKLDCGHHVTFGYYLGNDITIRNGKNPEITCLQCCY